MLTNFEAAWRSPQRTSKTPSMTTQAALTQTEGGGYSELETGGNQEAEGGGAQSVQSGGDTKEGTAKQGDNPSVRDSRAGRGRLRRH
ncbi:MAG: hypothetical protein KY412_04625 [Actinobacteria bacterium]|nr:hypothetical protein [Actinomycetota bacterium]